MAKNMTRKGLALGAAFAMVGSAVVATPAHAVDPVSLSINAGTSLNVFAQETVYLKALFTDAGQAASENLKYKIVDASEKLDITATESDTNTTSGEGGEVAGVALDANKTEVIDSGANTAGTANYLALVPATQAAGSEASFSVVVTAWMDFDGDDVVDAGEASATTTVNFLKYSDVTASWSVIDAEFGTTALKAEATLSPAMNTSYIASVTATVDGAATVAEKADTEGTLVVTDTAGAALAAGDTTFTLLYNSKEVGKKVVTLADTKVNSVAVALTDNTDTTAAGKVRTGTTSGTVVFTLKNSDGDALGAGIRTDVVINNSGVNAVVGADDTLTVAGKSVLTGASADVTVTYYSDANGQVVVPFSSAAGTAGNKFSLKATASGKTSSALTVLWEDAAYTAMTVVQDVTESADYQVTTTVGSSIPVSFKVEDQFGLAVADSYFVSVARTAGTRATTNGSFAGSAEFSGSTASINIVDNGAGTGTDTYTGTLVKRNTNGTTTATGVTATVDLTFAASTAVSAIAVKESDGADATWDDAVTFTDGAGDLSGTTAMSLADLSAVADVEVNTVVVETGVAGALVTLSSADLTFKVFGKSVYNAGSITLNADASGNVKVGYYSNTHGEHDIVISAGGKTVTATATFAEAAEGTATSLVVDAPSYITPGKTMTITATLTDKYGNPVKTSTASVFSLSYDGPGLIVGTIPSDTDADGKATFKVLLGTNETEAATVTASYDVTGTDNDIATTATIAAFGSAEVATWTKNLNDGTVKMYAKNIVGAGKVQFFLNGEEIAWVRAADASDAKLREANGFYYLVRTVELVEGQKNVLEIYVDGVRTKRTAYTY